MSIKVPRGPSTLHTRVIVSAWFDGDTFVRRTVDRGAKFHDQEDIDRVALECMEECRRSMFDPMADPVNGSRTIKYRVATRDAG